MKTFVVMALASATLAGCASGIANLRQVQPGMTPEQVTAIMGTRDVFTTASKDGDTYTIYGYANQYCNLNRSFDRCDLAVVFKNQKVVDARVVNRRAVNPDFTGALIGLQLMQQNRASAPPMTTTSCMAQPNGRQMNCTTTTW